MRFMSPNEQRAVFSLATIMSLRMFGLFMVLPLFALYASQLTGATPFLIGIGLGIYGFTQACFQIPFGTLSDYFGRKRIIALGLIIFALGSCIAAFSHSIEMMILGRALQGVGAVGSTIIAMIADLTKEENRTKAMALTGMMIGLSFSLAMMLGPVLTSFLHLNGIFILGAGLSILGIFLLYTVPTPKAEFKRTPTPLPALLAHTGLMRLNVGILFLHAIFTASFVIIPISLKNEAGLSADQQWSLFLPAISLGFVFSIICIVISEKKQLVVPFFRMGILVLALSELLFWFFAKNSLLFALSILLFFMAFSLLEAFLPSLVSRTAPPDSKGTALGIYSFAQFFGIFIGGTLGGWLYGKYGFMCVYLACASMSLVWIGFTVGMKNLKS